MKYRKKPIEVEAFQYGLDKEPEWFLEAIKSGIIQIHDNYLLILYKDHKIISNNGDDHKVNSSTLGDYIIKTKYGEIYPIQKETFLETYEKW